MLTRVQKIRHAIYIELSEYRFDKSLENDILFYILKQTIFSMRKYKGNDYNLRFYYEYLNITWDKKKTTIELVSNLIKILIEKGVNLSKKIKRHQNILDFAVLKKVEFTFIRIFLEAGIIPENPPILSTYFHKKMPDYLRNGYMRSYSENFSVCYALFVAQQTELRNTLSLAHHLKLSDRLYKTLIKNSKFLRVYLNNNLVNSKLFHQIDDGLNNFPADLVKLIASYDYRNHVIPDEAPSLSRFRFFSPPAIAKTALIGGMIGGISGAVIGAGVGAVASYVVNRDQDNTKLYKKF